MKRLFYSAGGPAFGAPLVMYAVRELTDNAAIVDAHFLTYPVGFKRVHGKFTQGVDRTSVARAASSPDARTRQSCCDIRWNCQVRPDFEVDPDFAGGRFAGGGFAGAVYRAGRAAAIQGARQRAGCAKTRIRGRRPLGAASEVQAGRRSVRSGGIRFIGRGSERVGRKAEQPALSANLGANCSTWSPERRNGARELGGSRPPSPGFLSRMYAGIVSIKLPAGSTNADRDTKKY